MTIEANKTVVRRFLEEMLSGHDAGLASALFTEDFVDHDADDPNGRLSGVGGARAEVQLYLDAFPDLQIVIDGLIAEDDRVFFRGRMTGTQSGPFAGLPATGRAVDVWAWQEYRCRDGKIAEAWLNVDRLSLLQQLGLAPQSAPA